jgi:putative membrane protein
LLPAIIFLGIFSALVCFGILHFLGIHPHEFEGTNAVHSLLGIVLGLFLVFRTNSAYDRWWAGRKLWGSLVNSTRNLAVKINAFFPVEDLEARKWYASMISNFVYAMKEHLREGVNFDEIEEAEPGFKENLAKVKHRPNKINAMMYERVNKYYRSGEITGDHLINLDKEFKDFLNIIGACERIKSTPIPYSYTMYIKKFIFIYLITLPFGFIGTFEYFTIPTVIIVSYILLSVEMIAEEIEDPFGRDVNDLPTDELSYKIRGNIYEILSVEDQFEPFDKSLFETN